MSPLIRSLAVLAVLLLAGLSILFVLDVISRELLETLAVKTVLVIGILALSGLLIGLLMGRDK